MRLTINNVRLSFPNLFEADKYDENSLPRYGCTLLIDKSDPQVKKVQAAVDAAATEKWQDKWKDAKFKRGTKVHGYRDGDEAEWDGFAGCMSVHANRAEKKGRPVIIDRDKSPLTADDGRPYAGCYVDAQVEFYADDRYGKAINCALIAVRFRADGEAFAGAGARPDLDEFEDLEDEGDSIFS